MGGIALLFGSFVTYVGLLLVLFGGREDYGRASLIVTCLGLCICVAGLALGDAYFTVKWEAVPTVLACE